MKRPKLTLTPFVPSSLTPDDLLSSMGRFRFFFLDENGEPVGTNDVVEWGRRFDNVSRTIAHTIVGLDARAKDPAEKVVRVATVFIGLAMPTFLEDDTDPLLWETTTFGGACDLEKTRTASKQAALEAHEQHCKRAREALKHGK